ncbi:MAG TPA: exodeoxyribonuclease I [Rhodospirillaceae bacterium]|nr:exodeoxyribonuclease I [Rhodospirillaceae bacterium]
MNEIDRFEIRCRLLPHVVPAPMALKVTGIATEKLSDPDVPSHYDAMRQVHAKLMDWSPSIFVGYNSISFDEKLLRQAFYETLQPIYLTNTGGNTRADMLRIAHAVAAYVPNAIAIPLGETGQQVFKLDRLAPANGFDHANAHDAMGDVEATIHLARLCRDRASEIWHRMMQLSRKRDAANILRREEVLCLTQYWRGQAHNRYVTECGVDPSYDVSRAVFDLKQDPKPYLHMTAEELVNELNKSPSVIRSVRTNAQPILMPSAAAPDGLVEQSVPFKELVSRASMIAENNEFKGRVGEALTRRYPVKDHSPHVELQIFDEFPSSRDKALMQKFHLAPWEHRLRIAMDMDDLRMKRIAQRLIYFERPEVLPVEIRELLDKEIQARLDAHSGVAPWRSVADARRELTKIQCEDVNGASAKFIRKTETFLADLLR